MTPSKEMPIQGSRHDINRATPALSVSPTAAFHTPGASFSHSIDNITAREETVRQLKPFETTDIKILLLENVNQSGRDVLTAQGYQVEFLKTSLPEDELIEKIR